MSLRVWLPLNGDLRNQGISKITINSGTQTYSTGKIGGQALDLINSTQTELFCDKLANVSTFSICAWIKGSKDTSDSDWVSPIRFRVNKAGGTANTDFRFGKHDNASGTEGYPVGVYHNSNNTISSSNNAFTTAEDWGKWVHICFIYDGTNIKGYKNGQQVFSHANGQCGYLTGYIYLRVGRCNWLVNDLRIYDHCLSAAEVKEIAQGLVLHYKLDNLYTISGTNLVTGVTKGGQTTVLTDGRIGVQTSGVNADTYFRLNLSENIVAGNSYLLSCDASGISEGEYWNFPVGAQSNSGTLNFTIKNGHNVYTFTANATKTDGSPMDWGTNQTLMLDDNYRGDALHPACFYNFELFKIGQNNTTIIVEDSSGYNNNGTITNTLPITNTPRYNNAMTSTAAATITNTTSTIPIALTTHRQYTLSAWLKTNATNNRWIYSIGTGTGTTRGLWLTTNGSKPHFAYSGSGAFTATIVVNDNNWHHIAFTVDDTTSKCYVDGTLCGSSTSTSTSVAGGNDIGLIFNGSDSLSDFRIYCTSLLDIDIKQLYNVSMKIDKSSKIHSFEVFENGQNKITKQGQLKCANIIEFNGLSYLKYDPNLYIEPDGSCWVRIFHHNNPAAALFASTDDFAHSVYKDENRWFNVELCNYLNSWELLVRSKRTVDDTEVVYRWIQSANPMTATAAQVTADLVTYNTNGYNTRSWGGIYKRATADYTYLNTHNGTAGNWYGAIGGYSLWNGGTTGQRTTGAANAITTGYVDLYVRIDNLSTTFPSNVKSTKNNLWLTSNIIER